MAKNRPNNFDSFQLLSPIILIVYLCLGFVPNLSAVDKIAPQWLGMTLLNLVSLSVFFFFRGSLKQTISKVLTPYLSLFYIGFIFRQRFTVLCDPYATLETLSKITSTSPLHASSMPDKMTS